MCAPLSSICRHPLGMLGCHDRLWVLTLYHTDCDGSISGQWSGVRGVGTLERWNVRTLAGSGVGGQGQIWPSQPSTCNLQPLTNRGRCSVVSGRWSLVGGQGSVVRGQCQGNLDPRLETPDSRLPTPDSRLQTP